MGFVSKKVCIVNFFYSFSILDIIRFIDFIIIINVCQVGF